MTTLPVVPIGTQRSGAFIDGRDPATGRAFGCFAQVDFPVYPPSPAGAELRRARVTAGLSLREGARRLAVRVVEMSDLECGASTFATAEEWVEARERLNGTAATSGSGGGKCSPSE